jgi:hypothetical protein
MFEFLIVVGLSTAVVKASIRCTGVALAICSWIAISNHCAFSAIATKSDSTLSACPFHSKPAKEKQQSSQAQCCKILRAVVLAKTKPWARDHVRFSDVDFFAEERAHTARCARTLPPLLLDTGPPEAHSFAELILQQSLFAHAPPSLT